MTRDNLDGPIDYLSAVRQDVQAALARGLSLEDTVAQAAMPEFRGDMLFDRVHPQLNVPAACKDLKGVR